MDPRARESRYRSMKRSSSSPRSPCASSEATTTRAALLDVARRTDRARGLALGRRRPARAFAAGARRHGLARVARTPARACADVRERPRRTRRGTSRAALAPPRVPVRDVGGGAPSRHHADRTAARPPARLLSQLDVARRPMGAMGRGPAQRHRRRRGGGEAEAGEGRRRPDREAHGRDTARVPRAGPPPGGLSRRPCVRARRAP